MRALKFPSPAPISTNGPRACAVRSSSVILVSKGQNDIVV